MIGKIFSKRNILKINILQLASFRFVIEISIASVIIVYF